MSTAGEPRSTAGEPSRAQQQSLAEQESPGAQQESPGEQQESPGEQQESSRISLDKRVFQLLDLALDPEERCANRNRPRIPEDPLDPCGSLASRMAGSRLRKRFHSLK
jgi:hypothetical protein